MKCGLTIYNSPNSTYYSDYTFKVRINWPGLREYNPGYRPEPEAALLFGEKYNEVWATSPECIMKTAPIAHIQVHFYYTFDVESTKAKSAGICSMKSRL